MNAETTMTGGRRAREHGDQAGRHGLGAAVARLRDHVGAACIAAFWALSFAALAVPDCPDTAGVLAAIRVSAAVMLGAGVAFQVVRDAGWRNG